MMKITLLTGFILLCVTFTFAQTEFLFSEPVPRGSQLFRVNDQLILIHALPGESRAQKWTSFDSSLNVIDVKKLVSPDADMTISQSYLEGKHSIFRFDQLLVNNSVLVNAYHFDPQGNLIGSKEILPGKDRVDGKFRGVFMITQSAGKNYFLLTTIQPANEDSLTVTALIVDEQLNLLKNLHFSLAFERQFSDLYPALIDDDQNVFFVTAEKFDSYRLSTTIHCNFIRSGADKIDNVPINLSRKKIRDIQLSSRNDSLQVSALYSDKKNSTDIAGLIYTGFRVSTSTPFIPKQYTFSPSLAKELKKKFGAEGRKGNILNYVNVLPGGIGNSWYAYLQHPANTRVINAPGAAAPYIPGMGDLHVTNQAVNSLVGTQPFGYAQPITQADANVAVAMQNTMRQHNSEVEQAKNSLRGRDLANPGKQRPSKNLLLLSLNDSLWQVDGQAIKITPADSELYEFFALVPDDNEYGLMYYDEPGIGQPILKRAFIRGSKNSNSAIFESKNKILLPGYPVVISGGNVYAFIIDRYTEQMSLQKIRYR